jgi:hypothetical protein
MTVIYEIVHVLPDKSEQILHSVDSLAEVPYFVDNPRFVGTWISETRKILRYGRGELRIREVQKPMRIVSKEVLEERDVEKVLLKIENGYDLHWIEITADSISGYDILRKAPLWTVTNFAMLALQLDNKEVAFECMEHYEMFTSVYGIKGAM